MRHIGTLPDETSARRFGDYLLTRGIQADVERGEQDWSIWIYDEDDVARSREELAAYLASPNSPQYQEAAGAAAALREQTIKSAVAARKNVVNVRDRWRRPSTASAPITLILMFISIVVAFYTHMGSENEEAMAKIRISPFEERIFVDGPPPLHKIREGEIWRLITPIFLHFGPMHIVFNMWMLFQFGMMVEFRMGSFRYLVLVLAIAIVSNIAQYWFRGPYFGGMSGVLYGLFGYAWMKSRFDPHAGYYLAQSTVTIMMGWYVLCMIGAVGNVANWAHGAGLFVGVVAGIAGIKLKDLRNSSS
ncbi:MAG: rhomboid family intramembrane serine protease [Planctomycetaceae bacterium]